MATMAMDKTFFFRQMSRLAAGFDRKMDDDLIDTYYDRMKNHNPSIFEAAVDHLLDTADKFPNIPALHKAYYDERDRREEKIAAQGMDKDHALAAGRRNAERLAREGLPS